MSYNREGLEEERRGILKWLFDLAFGRRGDPDGEAGSKIHRLGTINRHLDREDD